MKFIGYLALLISAILMVILIVGCATNGQAPTAAQTFTQTVASAAAANDAVVTTATQALNSGQLTSAQAQRVLTITDGINLTLNKANNAYQAGDPTSAESLLADVTSALVTLQSCVIATNAKLSLDSCLTGVH